MSTPTIKVTGYERKADAYMVRLRAISDEVKQINAEIDAQWDRRAMRFCRSVLRGLDNLFGRWGKP